MNDAGDSTQAKWEEMFGEKKEEVVKKVKVNKPSRKQSEGRGKEVTTKSKRVIEIPKELALKEETPKKEGHVIY